MQENESGNNLRVCVITSTYPRSHDDVAVPWLRRHVDEMRRAGCEITVLAPSYRGLRSHKIDGVEVVRFRYFFAANEDLTHDSGAPTKVRSFRYVALSACYLAMGIFAWRAFVRRRPVDLVHIHWPFPHGLFVKGVAAHKNPAIVLNFHGAELMLMKKFGFVRKALASIAEQSNAIVANSSFTKSQIAAVSAREVTVIPYGNPIPIDRDLPAKKANDPARILFVGRLIERKGVTYLLQAMRKVHEATGSELTVVGSGTLAGPLQAEAKERGLEGIVTFKSNLSNDQLAEEYATADIFCLPAIVDSTGDTEGLGVVLVEAISFGCALVASNVGGIPDVVVQGQTGVLTPERDPAGLAKELIALARDAPRREELARSARELVRDKFGWEAVTRDTLATYQKAVASKTGNRALILRN